MNWTAATCWALLLVAAFLCDSSTAKGGRGGARGSARGGLRGGARGAPRVRVRPPTRYGGAGSSLRVAAAGAAAGAAVGLAAGSGWRRAAGTWEHGTGDDEDWVPGSNGTGPGVYSYRAWTSRAGPVHSSPRLCLLLGSVFGALEQLRP